MRLLKSCKSSLLKKNFFIRFWLPADNFNKGDKMIWQTLNVAIARKNIHK